MSGRRRMPEPAIPVANTGVSTPTEVPAPPLSPGEGEQGRLDSSIITADMEESSLSPEEGLMFSSLLTCGKRSKTLNILDHVVVVESLNAVDDLRIALYAKNYVGTTGEQRAFQIAVAAAGLRSINGQPVVTALYQNADEAVLFDQKIRKVEDMYPTVVNRIYKGVMAVEREFLELVERMGKSFG